MAVEQAVAFVDLHAQYESIRDEVRQAIDDVLERGDFVLGGAVSAFEGAFAAYCEAEHAVGVDSGLSALEVGLWAHGIGAGDEVITAANTFIASALPISALGATPVLVDADEASHTMDVGLLEAAVTSRTKAIVPVHLYGRPADMDAIMDLAAQHGLVVVEDACQAHGARHRGRRVGAIGHVGAFSFYPAKNLGAYGDGGMLVTNDAAVAERARLYRNYGSRTKYRHEIQGSNRRLDTIHAAVLMVKLGHLDDWNAARRRLAARYDELLADTDLILPAPAPGHEHVHHLYVVRSRERDALQAHLAGEGIATGIHYPVPVHLQEAYAPLGYRAGDFPVAEALAGEILSLPMYAELPSESVARVAETIGGFEAGATRGAARAAARAAGAA